MWNAAVLSKGWGTAPRTETQAVTKDYVTGVLSQFIALFTERFQET